MQAFRFLLLPVVVFALCQQQAVAQEKKNADCRVEKSSDGKPYNSRRGLLVMFGPPGAQNGHSNPLGIPPGIQDLQVSYLTPCGHEFSFSIVPGLTYGLRYRKGPYLYGGLGGGLLITANGIGPGAYAAIGASFVRTNNVTFEAEFRQALGIGMGIGDAHIISPFSLRLGIGFYWD